MKIVTAQQMQELDRQAIAGGIPGSDLMERAGKGVFDALRDHFPDAIMRGVVVLCGKGNNGGDGFVIARHCRAAQIPAAVFLIGTADKVAGDARTSLERYRAASGTLQEVSTEDDAQKIRAALDGAGVIVDALLGTGISAPVTGLYRHVIEAMNRTVGARVVAVDIPSGIDGTSGAILGEAVRAHLTCTFALPKRGLVLAPGAGHVGRIQVIDIGIPQELVDGVAVREFLIAEEDFAGTLPRRAFDAHKGNFGHVLVIAGSPGMTGAAAIAGSAAMRSGAGLVTVAVPAALNPILEVKLTEVMTMPLPDADTGFLGMQALSSIRDGLSGKSVVVIGPGLSPREETVAVVRRMLDGLAIPVILDADGLNAVAADPSCLTTAKARVIITPHPGEMARLAQCSTSDVQQDRIGCARRFAQHYGVIVVLKGAHTIIADPEGSVFVNPTGNPGMATGGMGDALTGMIAGIVAQGVQPLHAAQLAVYTHGRIGDIVAAERAAIGILASDVIERIPAALYRIAGR